MIGKKNSDLLSGIITISFLTCSILLYIFGNENFNLESLDKIILSEATKEGIDIAARTFFLYKIIFSAIIIFTIVFKGLKIFIAHFRIFDTEILKSSSTISTVGMMAVYLEIAYGGYMPFVILTFSSLLLLCLYWVTTYFASHKLRLNINAGNFAEILALGFIMSFVSKFIIYSENSRFTIPFLALFILFSLLFGAFYTIDPIIKINHRKVALFASMAGLVIFPAFELFQLMSSSGIKSFTFLYGILLVFSILISFVSVRYFPFKKPRLQNLKDVEILTFTILLLVLLGGMYFPERPQSTEIFELANPVNAQMRFFKYGEIPFLDFMSSHMFSEEFYGFIYHMFYGYDGSLDFMTYDFLYNFLFYIIVFFFLQKLFKHPIPAFLFVVTFPFSFYLFGRHLFWNIVGFSILYRITRQPGTRDYFLWLSIIALMIMWRLDTGASFLTASAIFLGISTFLNKRSILNPFLLKGVLYFLLMMGTILSVFLLFRSSSYVADHFKSALAYITAGQAHGTAALSQIYNHHFYLFYFIMPSLGLFSVACIIYLLYKNGNKIVQNVQYILYSSLFLFLLYFANFQRGVVRHNFFMETDHQLSSTFYIAMLLLIFAALYQKIMVYHRFTYFYTGGFILLLFTKYFPLYADVPIQKFWDSPYLKQSFNPSKQITQRTIPNQEFNSAYFKNFKLFLDSNIRADQTFLDFSNNPILYFYCQRSVPSYFCQSLQNSIDDYLQLAHISKAQKEKVPVVVYANHPKMWGDETDGISNNIRQYLIAEHIFKHYEPFGIIDNKSIWIDKEIIKPAPTSIKDTLLYEANVYSYKKMAYFIGKYYSENKADYLKILRNDTINISKEASKYYINIPRDVSTAGSIYLSLQIESDENNKELILKVEDNNNNPLGSFTFNTFAGKHTYLVRLSSQYLWHKFDNKKIILENAADPQIEISYLIDQRL